MYLSVAPLRLLVSDPERAMLCRAGQSHRLSGARPSIDTLQEADIEAILDRVCIDTVMPSIWGVGRLLQILGTFRQFHYINSFPLSIEDCCLLHRPVSAGLLQA